MRDHRFQGSRLKALLQGIELLNWPVILLLIYPPLGRRPNGIVVQGVERQEPRKEHRAMDGPL
jgi:hypothetical protein